MSFTGLVLKFAAPLPDPASFQRFLFIGPHPDDIEIGAGASAARFAAEGKNVCFLICLDGRFGGGHCPELSLEELVETRKQEAIRSAKELGVSDVRFLDLCDGGFYSFDELIRGIAPVIGDFQPDVIFAPDPDVISECHVDHKNVGKAAKQLACFAPYGGIMKEYGACAAPVKELALYMTAKPNRYINTSGYFTQQLSSIFSCHLTQFPADSPDVQSVSLYLKLRAYDFGIHAFCKTAEGFRCLGQTQMHCLPEASL